MVSIWCCILAESLLYFTCVPPSSSGLGHRPFKPVTAIRIRLGVPILFINSNFAPNNEPLNRYLYLLIYIFIAIKFPEGSAMLAGIQCSHWILTRNSILDDKGGNRSFRVAVEKNVMPQAQA